MLGSAPTARLQPRKSYLNSDHSCNTITDGSILPSLHDLADATEVAVPFDFLWDDNLHSGGPELQMKLPPLFALSATGLYLSKFRPVLLCSFPRPRDEDLPDAAGTRDRTDEALSPLLCKALA
jgi:hypothetical protein